MRPCLTSHLLCLLILHSSLLSLHVHNSTDCVLTLLSITLLCHTQYTVELTLEEIFFGCLKKVTHKRKVLHESGECTEETRTLTIDVKSGLPSGTRFVFEG